MQLSWMLWLCVGFLIGYRYHVHEVGDKKQKEIDRQVDRILAEAAVYELGRTDRYEGG